MTPLGLVDWTFNPFAVSEVSSPSLSVFYYFFGYSIMRVSRSFSFAATISSSATATIRQPSAVTTGKGLPWRHLTVEWSPSVSELRHADPSNFQAVTHLVCPDLPQVYTPEQRKIYLQTVPPNQRIQTLAACRHTTWQSLVETAKSRLEWTESKGGSGKLLLVGGNDKSENTISTVEAAHILRKELTDGAELWGVADPNDPESVEQVHAKAEAGITGFMTQPLMTSTAWDTLDSYLTVDSEISIIVGMALPRSAQSLQFWRQLLDRPELLDDDPLFQSHLAYFSQPYTTSLAWVGRELQQHITNTAAASANGRTTRAVVDGIHMMPLRNTQDLRSILQSLARY